MTVDTIDENGHKVTLDSISRDDADKFHKEHQAAFSGSLASDLNILKSERANDVPSGIAELRQFIHQEWKQCSEANKIIIFTKLYYWKYDTSEGPLVEEPRLKHLSLVVFVHVLLFGDGVPLWKSKQKGFEVLTSTLGELDEGLRSSSKSPAILLNAMASKDLIQEFF